MMMINTLNKDREGKEYNEDKKKALLDSIKADRVSYEMYQKIYDLIPQEYICEKDRIMGDEELGFESKCTKRKLNKEQDKEIIDILKAFAHEHNLTKNQLAFNDHFEDYFIWTIYISK